MYENYAFSIDYFFHKYMLLLTNCKYENTEQFFVYNLFYF